MRAYIDIFAGLESRARDNAKAQQESNQRIIDQVQSYKALEPQLEKLNELKDAMECRNSYDFQKKKRKALKKQ